MTDIREEVNVSPLTYRGTIDIESKSVRDSINQMIFGVTEKAFITPYIALERVRKTLAYYHIHIPGILFLSGGEGVKTFPANQFDNISGMNDQGQLVSKLDAPYSIFFEWRMNKKGTFDVFCMLVDEQEKTQLLADVANEKSVNSISDERNDQLNEGYFTDNFKYNQEKKK